MCVPRIHRLCEDDNCWCYFDANTFSIQDIAIEKVFYNGMANTTFALNFATFNKE